MVKVKDKKNSAGEQTNKKNNDTSDKKDSTDEQKRLYWQGNYN